MAKEAANQLELFQFNPEIKNLGLVHFTLKSGVISGAFEAATETPDLAHLTPERWAQAAAAWVVRLCQGNLFMARDFVEMAHHDFHKMLLDRRLDEGGETVDERYAEEIGAVAATMIEQGAMVERDYSNEPPDSDEHAQEAVQGDAGDAKTENVGEGSGVDENEATAAPVRRFPRGVK